MLKLNRMIYVLCVLFLAISLVFIAGCKHDDEDEPVEEIPEPEDPPNSVSIIVVNNSNNLIRFSLAISDEYVYYSDFAGCYLCQWDVENWAETIIEIGIGNTANHTIELGDDLSAIRDWFIQFEEEGFPDDWRNCHGITETNRYEFEAGKTYTISVNAASMGGDDYNITSE